MLWVLLAALQNAPATSPTLGYPIFIRSDEKGCVFHIQDMLMPREDMAEWMRDLPDKDRQIDLVVDASSPARCVRAARTAARKAGFSRIVMQDGAKLDYGRGAYFP